MPGFGMQGFGMGGDWRMAPFNGFGGFAPMQPSQGMMRPSTGGGGFAPMPGGMSSDDDSFGAFPGGPLTGLYPNDGPPSAVPGFGGGPSMGGIPGVGPGLQGPRPGGVSPIGPGLQGPGGMPGSGMQRPGGMMSPGGRQPGSGRSNPWAGDSIGDRPYWQQPAAPASGQTTPNASGQGLFGPQSNFQMNTRGFDGQNYANQGDYWNKVGAFVDAINQDRARLSGQSGQQMGPPPQRDFAGMWQQAGDKVQGGWQNPFAQQQPSGPQGGNQLGGDRWFAGGTPYFDERTGQRTQPPSGGSGRNASPGGSPQGGAYSAYGGGQSAGGYLKPQTSAPGGGQKDIFPGGTPDWRNVGKTGGSAYNRIASSAPQSMYRR